MDQQIAMERRVKAARVAPPRNAVNLLILEDRAADVDLIRCVLDTSEMDATIVHVTTREGFVTALEERPWDAICADFIVPGFGAAEALEIVRASGRDTPFIILSGIATTEEVVALMKAGAADFVQKDDLARLAPAIRREVREAEDRLARQVAEREVRQLSRAIDQCPVSVIIVRADGIVEYVNRQTCIASGFEKVELIGRPLENLRWRMADGEVIDAAIDEARRGLTWQGEVRSFRKDGSTYWESTSISGSRDADGTITHIVLVAEDITLRKVYEERLMRQAHFDGLTDLPNRFLAIDRLSLALARSRRQGLPVAVGFIDLDDFKKVNDTLGHTFGDNLLKEAATRLQACVRAVDTVGRMGGDEFVIILPDMTQTANVEVVAEKVLAAFRRPFIADGHEVICTASIGLTIFPSDGDDAHSLLRNADAAMYQAKRQGKNTFRYYTQSMNEQACRRLEIEEGLHRALADDEIFIEFQPIIELRTRQLCGMEALVRWSQGGFCPVAPLEFIPVAEDAGLIHELGRYVLEKSCLECRRWSDLLNRPLTLSVNVSSRQIREPGFLDIVDRALRGSRLDPACLELEITERLLIADERRSRDTLAMLRDRGVRLAIDDFGTGYSSLSYVKRFPVTTVKIDRSFVEGVPAESEDVALARAIIAMAHALELDVVAEGVETPHQELFLRGEGCDRAQGFLFAKPLSSRAFTAYIHGGLAFQPE